MRGSRRDDGTVVHLLAAALHGGPDGRAAIT
jgi:hypothetical protein